MFAQFFGAYLFNNKLVSAEQLTTAIEQKKNTRLRLGVIAINAGLMSAEQVEHVNQTQQSVDKRFGDLAVELGYITSEDVEKLLAQQPMDYLLLGQTLVNNGALSNADFEKALNDYKAATQFADDDISKNQTEQLAKLVNEFYHFDTAENARIYTDYVTLLFKNIIRFVGDDFTPLKACILRNFEAKYFVRQNISGSYGMNTSIGADRDEYIAFAERFSKEPLSELDDYVNETVGEFLNVHNGLFLVNESNDSGVELTMTPQEYIANENVQFEKPAFCIPVAFSFGEIDFIVGIN